MKDYSLEWAEKINKVKLKKLDPFLIFTQNNFM